MVKTNLNIQLSANIISKNIYNYKRQCYENSHWSSFVVKCSHWSAYICQLTMMKDCDQELVQLFSDKFGWLLYSVVDSIYVMFLKEVKQQMSPLLPGWVNVRVVEL